MPSITSHQLFTDQPVRPPFDPGLEPVIAALTQASPPLSNETLAATREAAAQAPRPDFTAAGRVTVEDRVIPGPAGAPDLTVTILRPAGTTAALPGIYYIHGGAMVMGDRTLMLDEVLPFVAEGSAVAVSVEYRLAPEHPAPAQIDDCYAGLVWMHEHAAQIGIDPARIMTMGISSGGGAALGLGLMARDRRGPALTHQILIAPMIDDRFDTPSSRMLEGMPSDRNDYLFGWDALLGDRRGTAEVSEYVAPARATDLSDLPPTYIDTGGSEGCRDEILTMAMRLSQAGVTVDAHMWGGGTHGFLFMAPDLAISRAARSTLHAYLRRALAQ